MATQKPTEGTKQSTKQTTQGQQNGKRERKRGGKGTTAQLDAGERGNGEMFEPDAMKVGRKTPQLSVPRDNQLTVLALAGHASKLLTLAESNRKAGYRPTAATQRGDAQAIVERIIPLFGEQATIPLASPEESRAAIANMLRPILRRSNARKDNDDGLISALAYHVEQLGEAIYSRGLNDGISARESDPNVSIVRAVAAHDATIDEQVAQANAEAGK